MPVATSIMSGSIETIPTQPRRWSPKCTLPSRPPVMPPSRPMYWPRMRAGVTPRTRCPPRSRCRMHRRSCGAHREGRADRHGLLPEAVVEGAGHLALAIQVHRALLDAPHEEHVAQERDAIVERQVLGCGVRRVGARGLGCHRACCSLRGRGPARDRRAQGPSLAPVAGIAGPRGGASHSRLRRVADPYPSRMGEALWQTRLRWRLRGAMLWPAFVGRGRGRGRAARPAARRQATAGPGLFAAVLLAGFAQPRRRRRRRAAGRALAAPPPPGDARGDRHRPGGHRAARRGAVRWSWPWASLHRSSVQRRARRPQRPGGLGAALRHQPGARASSRPTPTTSTRSSRATTSTARASPAPTPNAPSASSSTPTSRRPGVTRDPDQRPNAAVERSGRVVRAALAALLRTASPRGAGGGPFRRRRSGLLES